jgi:hypothetical protein
MRSLEALPIRLWEPSLSLLACDVIGFVSKSNEVDPSVGFFKVDFPEP